MISTSSLQDKDDDYRQPPISQERKRNPWTQFSCIRFRPFHYPDHPRDLFIVQPQSLLTNRDQNNIYQEVFTLTLPQSTATTTTTDPVHSKKSKHRRIVAVFVGQMIANRSMVRMGDLVAYVRRRHDGLVCGIHSPKTGKLFFKTSLGYELQMGDPIFAILDEERMQQDLEKHYDHHDDDTSNDSTSSTATAIATEHPKQQSTYKDDDNDVENLMRENTELRHRLAKALKQQQREEQEGERQRQIKEQEQLQQPDYKDYFVVQTDPFPSKVKIKQKYTNPKSIKKNKTNKTGKFSKHKGKKKYHNHPFQVMNGWFKSFKDFSIPT
jgi:hypothetical protein